MIGNVVEKYEVLQKIGEGGMATVYRGRHVTLGREVAIKVLHPHLSASERNRQRFAREARAIEHLEHDNILKIFDYSGTDVDACYIVTEFVDGVTLQKLLNERSRIPSEVTATIGLRLAEALNYAHQLGIIHRDLKLENVMIRKDGTLKLMDFGIARFLDEVNLTLTGALVGSPAYMSPEQAMERVLDSRSDLFSLGTLMFHLVTGQLPFTGGNPSIVLRNVIESNRPSVHELAPDISGELADLIESLMQTDPNDRPTSALEVIDLLHGCLASTQIEPDQEKWSIQSWLLDPSSYEQRLNEWLSTHLFEEGKRRLADSDHLGALRMFNRLLSMDDENQEVLDLIRGMHGTRKSKYRKRHILPVAFLALVAVAALVSLMWPAGDGMGPVSPSSDDGLDPIQQPVDVDVVDIENMDVLDSEPLVVPGKTKAETDVQAELPVVSTKKIKKIPDTKAPAKVSKEPPRSSAENAMVLVTVPGSWGDIYIDGELKGRTGAIGKIEVTPGTHILGVRNDHALPYQQNFTVAPGENKVVEVTSLQRKPARFRLLNSPSPECVVIVDGIRRGTVGSLARTYRTRTPEKGHNLTVECPDGTNITRSLNSVGPGALIPVDLSTP
ncbi:MAG: serine/threonine protein kinase [Myxococcota bacterium]